METKAQKAKEHFLQGYNCAQCIMLAFAKDFNMDEETALRLSSSFGSGMGGQQDTCGALTGIYMVCGLKYGYSKAKDFRAKADLYELIKKLTAEFKAENGSIVCRELLGLDTILTSQPKRAERRPCSELVYSAAQIVEEYMKNNP
ncbi:C_GCAxxG_C_C family probable redox protein [Elusimicrobium posterum]|uniref:C-GCAxxG-C-C family protein n=1 Tax=Elusimicrobium posterum TaxID=3116653 RepID=UPI003C70E1EC